MATPGPAPTVRVEVLNALGVLYQDRQRPIRPAEIAQTLGRSRQTVRTHLRRLVQSGEAMHVHWAGGYLPKSDLGELGR